jgi:hypothetical protein
MILNRNRICKGQASFELVVTVVIILSFFIGFVIFLQMQFLFFADKNAYDSMQNVASDFVVVLEQSRLLRSGYSQTIDLGDMVPIGMSVSFLNGTAIVVTDLASSRQFVSYLPDRLHFYDDSCGGDIRQLHQLRKEYDQVVLCCGECASPGAYCRVDDVISRCDSAYHARNNVSFVVECPYVGLERTDISYFAILNESSGNSIYSNIAEFLFYSLTYGNKTSFVLNENVTLSRHDFRIDFECDDGIGGPYDFNMPLHFS